MGQNFSSNINNECFIGVKKILLYEKFCLPKISLLKQKEEKT